ncbi:MAG: hypothetical protein LBG96_07995 [Tannerella sp.]|jgi:hypothetical protein|nr:hypothetical protein [Tannerella sp.]
MTWLLSINKTTCYWTLAIVTIVFSIASSHFLMTDELYYSSYAEQLTKEQIHQMLTWANDSVLRFLGYIILPVIILVRVLFTSFCLQVGNLIQEYHWKYEKLYNISLKADAIYLLSSVCNFYFYAFFQPAKNIKELNINFLSVLKLKGFENVQSWLVMAFNSLNVFELLYIILLIVLIKASLRLSFLKSTIFVILTYCIGNYIYVIAMTFVYLNVAQ